MTQHRTIRGLKVLTALSLLCAAAHADSPPPLQRVDELTPLQPTLPEMTVQGQRDALRHRVQTFVSKSIRDPYERSLARWDRPICSLVVGFPQDQNNWIHTRLSDIAAASGAPLASQPCEVNLVVMMTHDPHAIMKAWYKRDFHLFGDATEARIDTWLESPRAVRVWYNVQTENASESPNAIAAPGLGLSIASPGTSIPFDNFAEASHTVFNSVRAFSSVIVVFDSARVTGVDVKQLADYAALVGLAEIQLDADLAGAPTLLRLLSTPERARPPGLTDWDSAFLKALYETSQKDKLQRASITQNMVHRLAP